MSFLDPHLADIKGALVAGGGFGGAFYAVRWTLNWLAGRADRREAALDREHETLDMGWKEYRLSLERRMTSFERQNYALRVAFQHVSGALIRIDPQNEALQRAERVLAAAFPTDFSMGVMMAEEALEKGGRT